jgi:hypothetical protein
MDVKRIFGVLLTLLGLGGLLYAAADFMQGGVARASWIYLILGGVFFFSGISLIRSTGNPA